MSSKSFCLLTLESNNRTTGVEGVRGGTETNLEIGKSESILELNDV